MAPKIEGHKCKANSVVSKIWLCSWEENGFGHFLSTGHSFITATVGHHSPVFFEVCKTTLEETQPGMCYKIQQQGNRIKYSSVPLFIKIDNDLA